MLKRKMLEAMGIEDRVIDQIIEGHSETVEALKAERDDALAKAKDAEGLRQQLDEALAARDDDEWRAKYEAEAKAFEAYRADTEAKAAAREKRGLYRKLLEAAGVDPKRIDAVVRVTDLSGIEVENGQLKGAEELASKVKEEWADFIPVTKTVGAEVDNPPQTDPAPAAPSTIQEALAERYSAK